MLVAWTESRDGGSGYAEADFRRELVPIVDTYPFYTYVRVIVLSKGEDSEVVL